MPMNFPHPIHKPWPVFSFSPGPSFICFEKVALKEVNIKLSCHDVKYQGNKPAFCWLQILQSAECVQKLKEKWTSQTVCHHYTTARKVYNPEDQAGSIQAYHRVHRLHPHSWVTFYYDVTNIILLNCQMEKGCFVTLKTHICSFELVDGNKRKIAYPSPHFWSEWVDLN